MLLDRGAIAHARVLVVGAGGLGATATSALVRASVGSLTLLDDDVVEASNLHRQILYSDADVGKAKADVAAAALATLASSSGSQTEVTAYPRRFLPETALSDLANVDVVLEGADNMATKFLVADACRLANVPLVQAGVVRWNGWALLNAPGRSACLRCVFEDMPSRLSGREETCSVAGVVGPAVGVIGALEAALLVRHLGGDDTAAGELWSYDALRGTLRRRAVRQRAGCDLCDGRLQTLDAARYQAECAA